MLARDPMGMRRNFAMHRARSTVNAMTMKSKRLMLGLVPVTRSPVSKAVAGDTQHMKAAPVACMQAGEASRVALPFFLAAW